MNLCINQDYCTSIQRDGDGQRCRRRHAIADSEWRFNSRSSPLRLASKALRSCHRAVASRILFRASRSLFGFIVVIAHCSDGNGPDARAGHHVRRGSSKPDAGTSATPSRAKAAPQQDRLRDGFGDASSLSGDFSADEHASRDRKNQTSGNQHAR
jgi:hypothetical protein